MASFVLKDASLVLDGTDHSSDVLQITVTRSKDAPQNTGMGDDAHTYLADGLKDGSFTVTFKQDFDAAAVDATLDSVYESTTTVPFVIKPTSAAVSTSNPSFSGQCILTDYSPIDGSIGDVAQTSPAFQVSGGVTRATA